MTRKGLFVVAGLALGVFAGLQLLHWPAAQEVEETPETKVTEAEMETYIGIYTAMQADHDLTLDAALERRSLTLDRFRDIERRVQADQRLVDRVRLALLNQAKSRTAWSEVATQTPAPQAKAASTPRVARKKSRRR